MISKEMHTAINDQINAELWSAYLYLSMSLAAEAKALKGISDWFFIQWLEEQDHARIFQKYLADQGLQAQLKPIDAVPTRWGSAVEMFRDTLKHEQEVTAMIKKLIAQALKEQDFATFERLQWFIAEQVEEERNASDVLSLLDFYEKGTFDIIFVDDKLGEREYVKAPPLE